VDQIYVGGVEYRVFDHLYAVSESGQVLRNFAVCPLSSHPQGYLVAGRQRLVHRMVAICWLDKPDAANHVHHINGDKTDNRAENLCWLTPKQHIGGNHRITGRKMSEAAKQKLREYRTGKTATAATKQKLREAAIRLGRKPTKDPNYRHSEATKAKMSDNHGKKVACVVHGVRYPSFTAAGKANNERPLSLRKRCYSNKFPDYLVEG